MKIYLTFAALFFLFIGSGESYSRWPIYRKVYITDACPASRPACTRRCPFNYVHDGNGCNTCKCCPQVRCSFCWGRYVIAKQDNQCYTCSCKWGL